jgi:hypothetical protein
MNLTTLTYFLNVSEYKLYRVKFDTDPGGWKSGEDPYKLVLAKSPENAKDIAIKGSWYEDLHRDKDSNLVLEWRYDEDADVFDYTRYNEEDGEIRISVVEIRFEGFEMRIDTIRGHKINDILGDE